MGRYGSSPRSIMMNCLSVRGMVQKILRPPLPNAALVYRCCRPAVALLALLAILQLSGAARGSILPLGAPEAQAWSDMAFASGVTGGFNAGTKILSITAAPSNSLEIGSEFGPDNPGRHY